MFTLTADQQGKLLKQPESGMGYQLVEVVTEKNQALIAIAYNAERVAALNEPDLRARLHSAAAGFSVTGAGTQLRAIRVLGADELSRHAFSVAEAPSAHGARPGPAKDAAQIPCKAGEVFKRFSTFQNDRRIRPDGSLLPGSYATTEEDAHHVHTGEDAVAQYALPNPTPAVNVFTIMPQPATPIQSGIVEPAHGQPGGGVEVIFPGGTAAHTVSGLIKIPPR